jgi:citronellol/citronellal dehydrogenase
VLAPLSAIREECVGNLNGKTAIVTGASRGIGAQIATVLASEGAQVIAAARTLKEGDHPLEGSLETTVAAIIAAGGEATAFPCDISTPDGCDSLVTAAHDTYGPVDILVNNAALSYFVAIKDFAVNRWMRSWAINVHAPFILSQLVLADMLPRRDGRIISISSVSAIGPGRGPYEGDFREEYRLKGSSCYGAEKAALERFSQGLAAEVYPEGVGVAAVAPSLIVATPGTVYHNLVNGYGDPRGESTDMLAQAVLLLATQPLKTMTGRVGYSQQLLQEAGWITAGRGPGIEADWRVSGFSLM